MAHGSQRSCWNRDTIKLSLNTLKYAEQKQGDSFNGTWVSTHCYTGTHNWINPFTAPACTISGLNDAATRLQTRSYNIYCECYAFWWKSFHKPMRKRKQKRIRVSHFALLIVVFKLNHDREGVNNAAHSRYAIAVLRSEAIGLLWIDDKTYPAL